MWCNLGPSLIPFTLCPAKTIKTICNDDFFQLMHSTQGQRLRTNCYLIKSNNLSKS